MTWRTPSEKDSPWRIASPQPPHGWLYGLQGPAPLYGRALRQWQHGLALYGVRQDTAPDSWEVHHTLEARGSDAEPLIS